MGLGFHGFGAWPGAVVFRESTAQASKASAEAVDTRHPSKSTVPSSQTV